MPGGSVAQDSTGASPARLERMVLDVPIGLFNRALRRAIREGRVQLHELVLQYLWHYSEYRDPSGGGRRRKAALSKAERSAVAVKAARARWDGKDADRRRLETDRMRDCRHGQQRTVKELIALLHRPARSRVPGWPLTDD